MTLFSPISYLGALFILMGLMGCGEDEQKNEEIKEVLEYSFVVAGHAYGNPESYTSSIYPPMLDVLDTLIAHQQGVDQLILTGDVVAKPTPENWETVRSELDERAIKEWFIAPGNHDISPYMDSVIQTDKYLAHVRADYLFLILNTSHPGWTLDKQQITFVENTLNEHQENVNGIFVFSHQLWWENQPPASFQLDSLRPNSFALLEGPSTFWEDVFPLFEDIDKEVYFFAGDMGCHFSLMGYYEDHYENFHFYGSGMGGAVDDNLLHGKIYPDGHVEIERIDF